MEILEDMTWKPFLAMILTLNILIKMLIWSVFTFLCLIALGAQLNAVNVPSSCSWQISDFHPTQDNMDQEDINVRGKLRLEAENRNESAIKARIHVSVVSFYSKVRSEGRQGGMGFFWMFCPLLASSLVK